MTKLRGRWGRARRSGGGRCSIDCRVGWTRWAPGGQHSEDDTLTLTQPNQKRMSERRVAKLCIPFGHTPKQVGEGEFINSETIDDLDGIENWLRNLLTSLGDININRRVALGIPEPRAHEESHPSIAVVASLLEQLSANGYSGVFIPTYRPPGQLHGV